MSREVKRVPLDFNWEIGLIWYGYLVGKCIETNSGGCENCRKFAKVKKLKFTDYDCPIFAELEPPIGNGWQMWEATSEGSPMSPVFDSPEKLARWLADNDASAFGKETATYEQWLKMIMVGYAPSAIMKNGVVKSGVEAA